MHSSGAGGKESPAVRTEHRASVTRRRSKPMPKSVMVLMNPSLETDMDNMEDTMMMGKDTNHHEVNEEVNELEKLKKDKLSAFYEVERYKKLITYAIIFSFFSIFVAIFLVAWRFSMDKPTFQELREKVIRTPSEEPRMCVTVYPNSINKNFSDHDVGEALFLTPYIERGDLEEGAKLATVDHVMQSVKSFSGFLTVNATTNSNLFFWFFPAEQDEHEEDKEEESEMIPLLLWLQGGPGWPSMYGLFKENGPFLCGFDEEENEPFLVPNKVRNHAFSVNQ